MVKSKLFQSEEPKIYTLNKQMLRLVQSLLHNFIKPTYLSATSISNVQFKDPCNFMSNEELYLGVEVEIKLKLLVETKKNR